jgi:hypothetical protein
VLRLSHWSISAGAGPRSEPRTLGIGIRLEHEIRLAAIVSAYPGDVTMPESESAGAESGSETPSLPVDAQISDRIGGYVYGTIGVLVALGSLGAEPENLRAPVAALVVFVGAVAVWLAHAFSELVAERIRHRHRLGAGRPAAKLRSSWPIVSAALPSTVFICIGWAGLWSVSTSLRGSTILAVVALSLAGVLTARFSGDRGAAAAVDVVAAACLGIVIALLEFAVYHA